MITSRYYNEALKVQFMYTDVCLIINLIPCLGYFLDNGVMYCYFIQGAINDLAVLDRPKRRKQGSITKALC